MCAQIYILYGLTLCQIINAKKKKQNINKFRKRLNQFLLVDKILNCYANCLCLEYYFESVKILRNHLAKTEDFITFFFVSLFPSIFLKQIF
jgi:hypothetical protein